MDPVTASLVAVGSQVASTGASNLGSYLMYKHTREDNRQDATTAYNRTLDMWNKANEYNSPTAQMERLKQAGLNPNLVYGNGATTQASTPSAPQASSAPPARFEAPNMLPAISMYMDVKQKQANIDLTEEQKNNVIQRTINERTDNLLKTLDLDYFGTRNRRAGVELSNIEKYQGNAMELSNRNAEQDNILKVQQYINNEKNMDLLMKRYNLSEQEFREKVRQFNITADREERRLGFNIDQFNRQMQNWNTQYNQGVRQFDIKNFHDVRMYGGEDANDPESKITKFHQAIDWVFGMPFRNLK